MRTSMLLVLLAAVSVPARADDAKKQCNGEFFVINGKNICMVAAAPEDFYRTADTPQKTPAPGSLVITPHEKHGPYVKLSGGLTAGAQMGMDVLFDPRPYTYNRTDRRPLLTETSAASRDLNALPWGLSVQWSTDGKFWLDGGWERPSRGLVAIDTSRYLTVYTSIACREGQPCNTRLGSDQHNGYRFTVDDFALGFLYDITEDRSGYASILVGAGVDYRNIRNAVSTVRTDVSPFEPDRTTTATPVTLRASQTRLYGKLDLELYPAGKDRFVGLAVSARLLSDGRKEKQFITDTPLDENIVIGIQPGFYDVTARLIVRF